MTETEWETGSDPAAMLHLLRSGIDAKGTSLVSDRKLRLFASGCCRLYGVAADIDPDRDRIGGDRAWAESWCRVAPPGGPVFNYRTGRDEADVRAALLHDIFGNPFRPVTVREQVPSRWGGHYVFCRPLLTPQVLSLARECYDRREGLLDPVRLTVLSDALEEAGCPATELCAKCGDTGTVWNGGLPGDPGLPPGRVRCRPFAHDRRECTKGRPHPLLAHLRSPGPHVRGCFALDLLLGKE